MRRLKSRSVRRFGASWLVVGVATVAAATVLPTEAVAGRHPAELQVVLGAFVLEPSGIRLSMHPTEARITISVTAASPLKVCEVGTTFSRHWSGGCRRLGRRPLALPTSGGAVHIGFRVAPSNRRLTRVSRLVVRWHCVDHFFVLGHGATRVHATRPIFDC
jgi:hypothetical protein